MVRSAIQSVWTLLDWAVTGVPHMGSGVSEVGQGRVSVIDTVCVEIQIELNEKTVSLILNCDPFGIIQQIEGHTMLVVTPCDVLHHTGTT